MGVLESLGRSLSHAVASVIGLLVPRAGRCQACRQRSHSRRSLYTRSRAHSLVPAQAKTATMPTFQLERANFARWHPRVSITTSIIKKGRQRLTATSTALRATDGNLQGRRASETLILDNPTAVGSVGRCLMTAHSAP